MANFPRSVPGWHDPDLLKGRLQLGVTMVSMELGFKRLCTKDISEYRSKGFGTCRGLAVRSGYYAGLDGRSNAVEGVAMAVCKPLHDERAYTISVAASRALAQVEGRHRKRGVPTPERFSRGPEVPVLFEETAGIAEFHQVLACSVAAPSGRRW